MLATLAGSTIDVREQVLFIFIAVITEDPQMFVEFVSHASESNLKCEEVHFGP